MASKYPVNQRIRDLMKALGYTGEKTDAHKFGQILLGKKERTEKVKNVYADTSGVSTEILALITTKIVNKEGQRPNGHWLLTGEGPMFLPEKGTYILNTAGSDDYLIKNALTSIVNKEREIEQLKADLKAEKEKNSSMDKTSLPDSNKK